MKKLLSALTLLFVASAAFSVAKPKAVLINGFRPSEPGWYRSVDSQMAEMQQFLSKKGYSVRSFSPPVQTFGAVEQSMQGASIVVYWGHGVIIGSGVYAPNNANVGGLSIDGRHITPEALRRDIRFASNAIVLLPNSCYAAGNSSEDYGKVSRQILERRMTNYASAFIDAGATAVASCLDAKSFLSAYLSTKSFDTAYSKSASAGKDVRRNFDGFNFWYRETAKGGGLSTSSAFLWRK